MFIVQNPQEGSKFLQLYKDRLLSKFGKLSDLNLHL